MSSTGKTSVDDVGYFLLVLKPLVQVKTQNVDVIIVTIGSNYFFETDAQQTPLLSSSLSLSSLSLIDTLFRHHDLSVSSFNFIIKEHKILNSNTHSRRVQNAHNANGIIV